jgi:hypothetical protein
MAINFTFDQMLARGLDRARQTAADVEDARYKQGVLKDSQARTIIASEAEKRASAQAAFDNEYNTGKAEREARDLDLQEAKLWSDGVKAEDDRKYRNELIRQADEEIQLKGREITAKEKDEGTLVDIPEFMRTALNIPDKKIDSRLANSFSVFMQATANKEAAELSAGGKGGKGGKGGIETPFPNLTNADIRISIKTIRASLAGTREKSQGGGELDSSDAKQYAELLDKLDALEAELVSRESGKRGVEEEASADQDFRVKGGLGGTQPFSSPNGMSNSTLDALTDEAKRKYIATQNAMGIRSN